MSPVCAYIQQNKDNILFTQYSVQQDLFVDFSSQQEFLRQNIVSKISAECSHINHTYLETFRNLTCYEGLFRFLP